jgi:hypothetical protein
VNQQLLLKHDVEGPEGSFQIVETGLKLYTTKINVTWSVGNSKQRGIHSV